MKLKIMAMLLVALIALAASVFAQTSTGEVNGTVTDPTGAVIPGATVKLINKASNIESQALTNDSGYFTFVNVKPGSYTLRVELAGFKAAEIPQFDVGVNQTVTQNVSLTVGEVNQTVTVSAGAELIQTSSSELGTVIPEEAVEDLPLNGRNFTQLLSLTPGATPVNTAQGGSVTFQDAGPTGIPGTTIVKPSLHGQQNRSTSIFRTGSSTPICGARSTAFRQSSTCCRSSKSRAITTRPNTAASRAAS